MDRNLVVSVDVSGGGGTQPSVIDAPLRSDEASYPAAIEDAIISLDEAPRAHKNLTGEQAIDLLNDWL